MKPAWDKLMDEFKDSTTAVVADVDCTVQESLCSKVGVEGYPTIKHGSASDLKDYDGGREFEELLAFAKENLGPVCGPSSLELCDEAQKKEITDLQKLSDEELQNQIKSKYDAVAEKEKAFNEAVTELQQKYEDLSKAKDTEIAEIKKGGLGMMTSICNDRPSCTPPAPPPSADEDMGEDEEGPPEDEEGAEDFDESMADDEDPPIDEDEKQDTDL